MELNKKIAKELIEGDFIPNGERVNITNLKFRKTKDHEIYQCCKQTSYDTQSGPIYCGDLAEYIASVGKGIAALCKNCGNKVLKQNQIIDNT
jgi:hypothetical protein